LTTGRIAATHGRFNVFASWLQCIPPKTCFLGPNRVQIPNNISISSDIFTQRTAESPYTVTGRPFPPKLPIPMGPSERPYTSHWAALSPSQNCLFPWGDLDCHVIRDSLGPSNPTIQMATRLAEPFLRSSVHSVPILSNGPPLPHENCPFSLGIWTPSNTWLLRPTQILNPNGISIRSAVFAHLTTVTDRPCNLVCNNRLHLRTAMQPKK